jgi:hypothetical protein
LGLTLRAQDYINRVLIQAILCLPVDSRDGYANWSIAHL